jgi:hypothetical protein
MTTQIPVPSGPGRTVKIGRSFEEQIKDKEEATRKRRALFDALARFVRTNNKGWVTSLPGVMPMRIECRPDSELPDLLDNFDLRPLGTSSRLEGGLITPVLVFSLSPRK